MALVIARVVAGIIAGIMAMIMAITLPGAIRDTFYYIATVIIMQHRITSSNQSHFNIC